MAFNIFGPNPISDLLRTIVGWLPRVAVAVIAVVVASAIAHALRGGGVGVVTHPRVILKLSPQRLLPLGAIRILSTRSVGLGRFELPTPATQTQCATKLRYSP
ncbi:MAG: hypothetical protein JWR24_510 [Actinoallomurus sp.]|nr:hypothetical protein [Actinoallomurus sp.]